MSLSITIAELRAARDRARDLDYRIESLAAHLGRTPEDAEAVPLSTWAEVTFSIFDLFPLLQCCWNRGGRDVGVQVAIGAAVRALAHGRPESRQAWCAAMEAVHRGFDEAVTLEDYDAASFAIYAASVAAYNAKRVAGYNVECAFMRADLLSLLEAAP